MVDAYGRWTEEKDYTKYPKEKWCDYDYIAVWIREQGYKPATSMENLINMIFAHYDNPDNFSEFDKETGLSNYGYGFTIEGCKQYVIDCGGIEEFDYEC